MGAESEKPKETQTQPKQYDPFKYTDFQDYKNYRDEKPYYLHIKYKVKDANGNEEVIHHRAPFTAISDEHAKDKIDAYRKQMEFSTKLDAKENNVEVSDFEIGGHYNKKRGRSFQFVLSPDQGHGDKIEKKAERKVSGKSDEIKSIKDYLNKNNNPYISAEPTKPSPKMKFQPMKGFFGYGDYFKPISGTKAGDTDEYDEMKQLITVNHRSKKEAEEIAKDMYRRNNGYTQETPIKVHASHWV